MICVFTGGESPEAATAKSFFMQNLNCEKDRKIRSVAADSGIETFCKYQSELGIFKIESILGDWDSIKDKSRLDDFPPSIIETHVVDKDYTDTELALEKAYGMKIDSKEKIVLVGAGGGSRIDHLIAVYDLFSTELKPDVWIAGGQFLYFLAENSKMQISNLKHSDTVSVLRTSKSRTEGRIESCGLEWESNLFRKSGVPSISNRVADSSKNGNVELKAFDADFVIALPPSANVSFSL